MPECREVIMSEEYADFIAEYGAGSQAAVERFKDLCPQVINDRYVCLYERLKEFPNFGVANNTYNAIYYT